MANMYCSSCGGKLEYFSVKPKFCSHCGTSIGEAAVSAASVELDSQESAESGESVPSLNKMEYEIVSRPSTGMTVGGVIGTSSSADGIPSREPPRKSGQNILEEMKDSCASVRDKSTRVDGEKSNL